MLVIKTTVYNLKSPLACSVVGLAGLSLDMFALDILVLLNVLEVLALLCVPNILVILCVLEVLVLLCVLEVLFSYLSWKS